VLIRLEKRNSACVERDDNDGDDYLYEGPCGRWDPSEENEENKSEQVRQCMDLEHCLHWLHLEPTHQEKLGWPRRLTAAS
jgi:hypothetical protein